MDGPVEKFIALLTMVLLKHNRSLSNSEKPLMTLPIEQFEKNMNVDIYKPGFGILPELRDSSIGACSIESLPHEQNQTLIRNFKNLVVIAESLDLQSRAFTQQNVICCSPFKGIYDFYDQHELSRIFFFFNVMFDRKKEMTLCNALLTQFKSTILSDDIPACLTNTVSLSEKIHCINNSNILVPHCLYLILNTQETSHFY